MVFAEEPRIARFACYLTAFLPFSIAITINHRKEPIVVLIVTFCIYHGIRLIRTERNWQGDIPWLLAGLVAMSFFRSGYIYPFLATLLISFFFSQRSVLNAVAMSIVALLVIGGAQLAMTDLTSSSVTASSDRFRGKLKLSADYANQGGLVRLVRIASPIDLYKLPVAASLAAILPYPPYLRGSIPSIVLSWANLANLAFLPSMLFGVITIISRKDWRRCVPVVLFPALFLVVHGLVNIGVARYRETIFPIMLILAGVGLAQRGGGLIYGVVYAGLIFLGGLAYFMRY